MSVTIVEAMPDKVEPALVDQGEQAIGGAFAQGPLSGAFRTIELGSVDPDQPHSALSKPEGVAIDHAGHAASLAAACKACFDPLGSRRSRTDGRKNCGVEQCANERKQRDEQRRPDDPLALAADLALTGAAKSEGSHDSIMAQAQSVLKSPPRRA